MSEKLFEAAKSGDASRVKSLIESGIEVDAVDERGWTALFMACHNPDLDRGFPEVASSLIEAGADIEKTIGYGIRPLMIAAGYGEAAVVEVLLKAGAQVRAQNEGGRTALQMATDKNYIDVINLLWEAEMLSGETAACGSKPSSATVVNFFRR